VLFTPTVVLAGLLALAATAAIVLIFALGGSSTHTASQVRQTGGPNETLRGQAAAGAVGAQVPPPTGGPNETLRGQVAASASRH
jgi:hypothetical protein